MPHVKKQKSTKLILGQTLLLFVIVQTSTACTNSGQAESEFALVFRVIDGDTVVLKFGGETEMVRLIGVDTPETVHPTKGVECFGPEASAFTKQTLKVKTKVRLLRDVEARDKYQRLLVYLFLPDGTLFNNLLIEQGFARTLAIAPNTAFASQFAASESSARDRRVGLWQSCER